MEEVIRKKISVDKSRSHATGILQYLLYDNDDRGIYSVSTGDKSGNWGGFPLDFCFGIRTQEDVGHDIKVDKFRIKGCPEDPKSPTEEETYEAYAQNGRLKYCDIIMRYNKIQSLISDSILCKAVKQVWEVPTKIELTQNEDCERTFTEPDTNEEIVLTTRFDLSGCNETIEGKCLYDFIPINRDYFEKYNSVLYRERGHADIDNEVNEDECVVHEYDAHVDFASPNIEDGKYYMLMPEYETYREYEDWWKKWFEKNECSWSDYFDEEDGDFLFCKIVDKYILGKVCVPDDIEGIRVPNVVYYTEIPRLKGWFEKHGITSDADLEGKSKYLVKRYHENGGKRFYDFLCDIEPTWSQISFQGSGLTHTTPFIGVPITLEDVHDYGGLYENYIYSVNKITGEFEDATKPFVWYEDKERVTWLEGSGLTDVYGESKLEGVIEEKATEIDDFSGVWGEFPEDLVYTNVFKCTFYSDYSSEEGERVVEITNYEDGYVDGPNLVSNKDEIPALTVEEPDRVILVSVELVDKENSIETSGVPETEEHGSGITSSITAYTQYKYAWWECHRMTVMEYGDPEYEDVVLGDGEEYDPTYEPSLKKYRTITLLECFPQQLVGLDINPGDSFFFNVTKDNGLKFTGGAGVPVTTGNDGVVFFSLPYKAGTYHNIMEDGHGGYIGNYVLSTTIDSAGVFTIRYVIGGDMSGPNGGYINHTGVIYEESFPYTSGTLNTFIDDFEDVKVYYEKIDTESTKSYVYSDEYRISRYANIAKIVGMAVGGIFDDDMMVAPIFTRESSEFLQDAPKEIVDIVINRGEAAAFEKHFKLTECNTFEDLENYGNSYFFK